MAHMTHANARLTPAGRLALARCVVEVCADHRFRTTTVPSASAWAVRGDAGNGITGDGAHALDLHPL